MKPRIYRWGPAVLMMAIIFFASSTPGSDMPRFGSWDFLVKKGGHIAEYALLCLAYIYTLGGKSPSRNQIFTALVLSLLYACSDEWHQRFTPGRTPSVTDVLIDTTGAAVGIAVFYLVRRRPLLNKIENSR